MNFLCRVSGGLWTFRCWRGAILQFDAENENLVSADVFHGMWRQGFRPGDRRSLRNRSGLPGVERQSADLVPANKITPIPEMNHARPSVGMHRHELAGPNPHFQHSYVLALVEETMMRRCGHKCIQLTWPWPVGRWVHDFLNQWAVWSTRISLWVRPRRWKNSSTASWQPGHAP